MVESCPEGWGRVWRWRRRGKRGAWGTWTRGRPPTSYTIIRRWGPRQYSSVVRKAIIQLDSSVLYSCSSLKLVAWCSCFWLWEVSNNQFMPNGTLQFYLIFYSILNSQIFFLAGWKFLKYEYSACKAFILGPRINRLVTDKNTKLCCRGNILALFQSNTANKCGSEHTWDYKRLLPVCEAKILQVTVKRIEVFSSSYVDFWRFSAKNAKNS